MFRVIVRMRRERERERERKGGKRKKERWLACVFISKFAIGVLYEREILFPDSTKRNGDKRSFARISRVLRDDLEPDASVEELAFLDREYVTLCRVNMLSV